MRFRWPIFALNLCLLFIMGACGAGSSSSPSAVDNGIDESQIHSNPNLRANLSNVVAVHLEHPNGGEMSGDTSTTGQDIIPYTLNFFGQQNVEFCFVDDSSHTFKVLNSQNAILLEMQASPTCKSAKLNSGDYSFVFESSDAEPIEVSNFFIRQDSDSNNPRILINADCQNCDLSGLRMRGIDVSNRDFSGSNFNRAYLIDDVFLGANLTNTSFTQSDFSGSLFDDSDSIYAGEQITKEWVSDDGSYLLRFTFLYAASGQGPLVSLSILQDGTQVLNETIPANDSLAVNLASFTGSFQLLSLNLESSEDAGVWGDFCWGTSLGSCFQGVIVSYNSFDDALGSMVQSQLSALSSSNIELNFINLSNNLNNIQVTFFQKNLAASFDETAVAWTVLEFVGQGDNHPFQFPLDNYISASDSYGNFTPQLSAFPGQLFAMSSGVSGDELSYYGSATSVQEIQLLNLLSVGSINGNIYKDGKLLAVKNNVVPSQKAVFQFKPVLWVGATNEVVQGEVMDSAILSDLNTQLSLLGVASADIVMTGGGSSPLVFNMQNIVFQ